MSDATNKAHIILIGNEKGGTGKTTLSIHLIMNLLYDGYKVSSIDIDSKQRSLSQYLKNRFNYIEAHGSKIPTPNHYVVNNSQLDSQIEAEYDEEQRFQGCINKASQESDFIIIDSPGNINNLSKIAHANANTIITPINDSFIDLDVLAHIKTDSLNIEEPGTYSEFVWNARKLHAQQQQKSIDWVVVRNRLSNLSANNKAKMNEALSSLSERIGFKVAEGFSERVIYRELFLKGLTLLDLIAKAEQEHVKLSLSHIAARQELRNFINFLELDKKALRNQNNQTATTATEETNNEDEADEIGFAEDGFISAPNAAPTPATATLDDFIPLVETPERNQPEEPLTTTIQQEPRKPKSPPPLSIVSNNNETIAPPPPLKTGQGPSDVINE